MRRVIRAAFLGENAGDLSALENLNAKKLERQIVMNDFCIAEKTSPLVKSGTEIDYL
jgi:hypothetical protein